MKFFQVIYRFSVVVFILSIVILAGGTAVHAEDRIGVGVGTGKIIVDDPLKSGARYEIAPLSVINTGNIPAEYEVSITYHEQQKEKRPDLAWFAFVPNNFTLNPGEVKIVDISLLLPLKTEPGDYFAYVEARPIQLSTDGNTSVGVAAAAKLYFKVSPSNIFQAIFYRLKSFYLEYQLVTNIVIVTLIVFVIFRVLRKFISLDIKLKSPEKNNHVTRDTEHVDPKEHHKT